MYEVQDINNHFIIYFRLIFGLVNTLDFHLRLKNGFMWQGEGGIFSLKYILIEFAILNLSDLIFVDQIYLKLEFKAKFLTTNKR